MAPLLLRLSLSAAALTFGYGLVSASSAAVSTRHFVDAKGVRSEWSVDGQGRKHGEELVYRDAGRLLSRVVWDHGQAVESCWYHPNGRLSLRSADRFPWGVMRCEQFDESGRLVSSQEW